ncbi:MAG: hypothetical protein ACP5M4_16055, partial [Acidobacteriaceae bacterium]
MKRIKTSPFFIPEQMRQSLPSQVSQDFSLRRLAYLLPAADSGPCGQVIPVDVGTENALMWAA